MLDDDRLNAAQRAALAEYAGVAGEAEHDDAELLEAAAERIGMTGEMSIDPDGVVELLRDDILVAVESVADEDRALVEHPDQLQLAVFLRAQSAEDRAALASRGLIDDAADDNDDEWTIAPWGVLCTTLPRNADLPRQMELLERAMSEAETVVESGDVALFRHRLAELLHDPD